jgi:hypothetical protein
MFATYLCGLRSIIGNRLNCTCTIMRCPDYFVSNRDKRECRT